MLQKQIHLGCSKTFWEKVHIEIGIEDEYIFCYYHHFQVYLSLMNSYIKYHYTLDAFLQEV